MYSKVVFFSLGEERICFQVLKQERDDRRRLLSGKVEERHDGKMSKCDKTNCEHDEMRT